MGKLYKLSETTVEMINDAAESVGLLNFINVLTFGNKQKDVIKVKKASPTEEGLGNSPDSIIVYVNEDVFIKLSDEQQKLIVEDAINEVMFDPEKEKLNVTQPEIKMTVGGWRKYGEKLVNALETAILTRQQMEEEEKERKAAEKEMKKAKKNG